MKRSITDAAIMLLGAWEKPAGHHEFKPGDVVTWWCYSKERTDTIRSVNNGIAVFTSGRWAHTTSLTLKEKAK